ncbi:MAG: ABC transporter permease [Syntrophobacteraceae bacterium]
MIQFIKLSWNNILRYKTRSILTIFAVACSVGVLFSILSFDMGFERNLAKEIEKTGIDFMIVSKGCSFEVASLVLYGAVIPKYLDEGLLEKVKHVEDVETASPVLISQLPNLKSGRTDVVYGMEMSDIAKLKPQWHVDGRLPQSGYELILGYLIAEKYKVKIGDEVPYLRDGITFRIVGVLNRQNSQEDSAVFVPIQTLQELLARPGAVTSIGVKTNNPMMIGSVQDKLSVKIPGIQIIMMDEVRKNISSVASSARALTLTIAIVVAMISIMGVVDSILITLFERRREIGMMRAIGASPSDIFRLSLYETVILVSAGGGAGILLGIAGSGIVEDLVRVVTPYVPPGKIIAFEPKLGILLFLCSLLAGVLAGLYPAWKSSRVSPIEVINC